MKIKKTPNLVYIWFSFAIREMQFSLPFSEFRPIGGLNICVFSFLRAFDDRTKTGFRFRSTKTRIRRKTKNRANAEPCLEGRRTSKTVTIIVHVPSAHKASPRLQKTIIAFTCIILFPNSKRLHRASAAFVKMNPKLFDIVVENITQKCLPDEDEAKLVSKLMLTVLQGETTAEVATQNRCISAKKLQDYVNAARIALKSFDAGIQQAVR